MLPPVPLSGPAPYPPVLPSAELCDVETGDGACEDADAEDGTGAGLAGGGGMVGLWVRQLIISSLSVATGVEHAHWVPHILQRTRLRLISRVAVTAAEYMLSEMRSLSSVAAYFVSDFIVEVLGSIALTSALVSSLDILRPDSLELGLELGKTGWSDESTGTN